jgi:BirA family biotin operon repressor/biotin-[acetyl-CoA-carboxylase] ligase
MNDAAGVELESWRRAIASSPAPPRPLIVLDAIGSTMDAARLEPAGTAVFALRQHQGRGRLGRRWHDDEPDGVAMTAVLVAEDALAAARLGLAAAVGAAAAIESKLSTAAPSSRRVGIKWPNDVLVDGRKIAGVLVERIGDRALVGIGVNVLQRSFPAELADRATSLRLAVAPADPPDRAEVAAGLWRAFSEAVSLSEDALRSSWLRRDWLSGRRAILRHGTETLRGRVLAIDPLEAIEFEVESSEAEGTKRRLDAAMVEVIEVDREEWTSPPSRTDLPA